MGYRVYIGRDSSSNATCWEVINYELNDVWMQHVFITFFSIGATCSGKIDIIYY